MSNKIVLGKTEFFKGLGPVAYEGPQSDNIFAFRYYNAEQKVGGKTMAEHFKFSMAYWHSLCNSGADPFGSGPRPMAWDKYSDAKSRSEAKMDAAFEFMGKLGLGFYCFHDYDLVEEGQSLAESEKRLSDILEYAKIKQSESGIQLLWGTANLFSNPRYMNGASTNPDFRVVAHAAAQVKIALDMTVALGGQNYVFWGGREGYMSLLNTNMKREIEHLGKFLSIARDYGRQIGFKGNFLIEPKPCEPSKHQYDYDAATVSGFLRQYNLMDDFKLNLEVNHATLAGHTFSHEMQTAADQGLLGSLDANRGDAQNGWDTDQFPVDLYELTECMIVLLESGGLQGGGINFDAKLRRNSTDLEDIFIAHIGGMDTFARALLSAQALLEKSDYTARRKARYESFDSGQGKDFENGKLGLAQLRVLALGQSDIPQISGKQEYFENLINRFI